MSCRASILALAALCCVLTTGLSAWADTPKTNPVTGETETYVNKFIGDTAEWDRTDHWDTGVRPFISGGGGYSSSLVDGKEASTATSIDGWNLQVGAYGGAAITWATLSKIQGDTGMWLTVDGNSSITINGWGGGILGQAGKTLSYYVAKENGVTWNADLTSGTEGGLIMNYYLAGDGTVAYKALERATHIIKQADITLSGTSQIASKTLVSFTSTTKHIAASATIKRLNSSGANLESDAHLSIVNYSGETSLKTSDGVGKCELVQTSTGIVLYWVDGDPAALAPTVYRPSISVNFTSGTGLSTTDDVGIGDYAIPGTSWNNLVGNNGSLATVTGVDTNGSASTLYGAKVTISGTRGYWTRDGLDAASELRQGYIDDDNNNTSPTVVVEGIPYSRYKVVIVCSSDNNTTKFGYMTVNGTHYKGGSGTTETCSGADSDIWGSASDSTWIEGGNFLVTPEIVNTDGKLTIVSHLLSGCRAGIAAIQVVEVAPAITENDLVINVNGDTNYSVDETKDLSGTVYITGNGTLTLSGSEKITAASIDVGPLVTINANADRLDATTAYTGLGTVVYSNALPPSDKGWTDAGKWTGTVQIENVTDLVGGSSWSGSNFEPNKYGNSESVLELKNCSGWLPNDTNYQCAVPLKITGTLTINDGISGSKFVISKLLGNGKIYTTSNAATVTIQVLNADDFTGYVQLNSKRVIFGETIPETFTSGQIYVGSGFSFTVPNSNAAWYGTGGITLDGELKAVALSNFGGGTTITTTDNGVFTLITNSNADDMNTDYARLQGTGTLRLEGSAYRCISTNNFPTAMSVDNRLTTAGLLHRIPGREITIGSLAGDGYLRSDWGGSAGDRDLRILQAKDTTWSGKFWTTNPHRFRSLIVAPGAESAGTLTLSAEHEAAESTGLTIESGAAVNLTGTWVGNATVSGTFGGTGTLNGDLTFSEGSILKVFASDKDGLAVSGTVTYPPDEGTVTVDVGGIDLEGVYYIPLLSGKGLASKDTSKFKLANAIPFHFVFNDGTIGLERDSDYPALYNDHVTFTLNKIGTTPITNYTLLVRISKDLLPGFSYERAGKDGSQIAFTDGYGKPLSHEIDTWNIHGESLVWVKVPEAENGTKVKLYWSLKDGEVAPENVPGDVWSDYAGVWHMNDATDSTTNKTSGTNGKVASPKEGKIGNALGADTQGSALLTATQNDAINSLTGGVFSVSMWVNLNDAKNGPFFFSRESVVGSPGYGCQLWPGVNNWVILYYGGVIDNRYSKSMSALIPLNEWAKIDIVYSDTTAEMWLNGVSIASVTGINVPLVNGSDDFAIGGLLGEQTSGTVNGAIDEFRMRAGGIDTTQLAAEIANANFTDYCSATEGDGVSFLVPGAVVKDGVVKDYWRVQPSLSLDSWDIGTSPSLTYTPGVLRSGAEVAVAIETAAGTHLADFDGNPKFLLAISATGSYRLHFSRKDKTGAEVEDKYVYFAVKTPSGVSTVGDTKGGRILLMNNDFSQGGDEGSPSIGGQGYSDTNETASVYCYWAFPDGFDDIGLTINPKPGKSSILWSVDGDTTNKLWHLVSSRHGNTFPSDGSDLVPGQNYLPWSTKSCSITNGNVAAQSGADAGQILMLNTTDAMVYSPCYDEGIGTIYFDAVNGYTNNLAAYQLLVEYATVTTNHTPVVDANLWQYDDDDNVTNYYGNLDETCWQACQVKVARVTGGNAIDSISTFTGPFTLAVVSDSPTTGEFYRVYAELNIREPVRFRIRRANFDSDRGLDEAYLLLDNIIVSYPAMSATLSPAGQYDDTKKGSNVLGFESAFSSAFPYAGEKLFAKAKVDYYINSATNLTETNFLASAKMYYRWRYLNQASPKGWEWKCVELFNEGDFFRSSEELDLPEIPGDVEFWYEYIPQAPYYSYVDYTGLPELQNAFAKEYTEATLGPQTNRSTRVDFSYPTMGNDWFVRLREGASSNEVWRIYLRNVDGSAYNADGNGLDYVDFAITESGSWRGFVRTPDTVEAGLEYRIEQINPRADDLALTYSTNFWKGAATFTSTVKSISIVAAADGDEWSPVPCAGTTSFLMFVLDEDTPTLSVTSADLQNFNTWNYANKNEIVFVGTSTDDGKKNGVAPGMNTYSGEFDKWVPSYAEHPDGYWEEHFNETLGTGRFTGYTLIKESTTPNGWEMRNGMWIYEKYKDPNPADSMALQLQGGGNGSLALLGAGDDPRGIESVSFRARIAQSATLDNFAYKDANIGDGDTNYCFFVQAAMSTNAVTATDSWNSGFDGLGQLSLLAGYRQGKGGYELRIIRWQERRYRAELCKWVGDECQVVNECEANFNIYSQMPYTMVNDGVDKFPTLFISVDYQDDGSCKVQGGFSYGTAKNGGHSAKGALPDTGEYLTLSFWDAEPPTEWGSYGFASANCDAIFTDARICHSAAPKFDENVTKGTTYPRSAERFKKFNCATYNSYLGSFDSEAISKKKWSIPNRFTTNEVSQILAVADAQPLLIQWRRPTESNESDWKTLVTNDISSFTLSEVMEVPLLLTEDAYIRLKHGGGSGNVVDIAVDDVAIRQWRGDDYNSAKQTYFLDKGNGSPTNFVFTSAWLNDEGSVELTAARAMTNKVSSLRSPLMDGADGRGLGLGMFSFSYTNADSRAVLLLQVATGNNLANATLAEYTEALSDDTRWETVTNFVFSGLSEEKLAGGVMSHYLGRYGEKGVMRLVVDGQSVADAQASRDSTYGRIFITDVICRDEPKLDTSSWWGWNIRTSQDLYSNDDKLLANLADWPGSVGADAGMSLALNNSAEDDIDILEGVTYRQHQPFLQTPVFTNKTAVGEISFKARRYDYPSEFTPRVCVYGAHNGTEPDEEWKYVTHFDVTNDYYTTYTFKEKGTLGYEVLRLVVVGVDLVESHHGNLDDPGYGATPVVRVALDDVVVTEALMPKLAFKNVFAFRGDGSTDLLNTKYVNRFGDKAVQPLAGEAWGVQAEIYAEQLPDEIDFDRGVTVTLYWFDGGTNPWGYDNWKNRGSSEVHSAKLAECDDVSLAFRSSYAGEDGSSVVGQASEYSSGSIVQYMLKAEYYLKGDSAVRSVEMGSSEWVKPEWYNGVDYNSKYNGFSAYTILDSVAPGWAWINEVNIFGGFDDDNNIDKAMQYVEVAMPIEADLTGWHLDFLTRDNNNNILTNKAYTFSADQTTGRTKTKNGDSNCVFYVISGPESKQNLQALTVNVKGVEKKVEIDGTWLIESDKRSDFLYGDEGLDAMLKPIGMLLVRSSDIVEHSIVLEGTNYYYKIPNRSASAFAEHLSTVSPGIEWVAVGDDSIAGDHSLGVTNLPANVVANWNNMMARTPGFINDNQKIDPVHPVANSSSYIVYATFADDSAGHMTQTLGHHVGTTSLAMAVVPKGTATNITYNVENWYELASVTVDGVEQSLANRTGSVEVPLGGPATSNNISVVASSRIATTLSEDWGLTATNRYTSAVVDWLNKGCTLRGAFANPAGKIAAAQFVPLSRNPDASRDLTLTEMYWLDIDPTDIDSFTGSNNWWFVGGMIKPPIPNVIVKPSYQDGLDESNLTMGMYMCITNTATSDYFAPYVLRGVEVGSVSTNYSISGTTQWEGPTFKILGRLFNTDIGGNPDEFAAWLPLRSFVLNENSFRPKGESDEFQSVIEVFDPYSTDSVGGANAGWGKFKGKSTVFFSWSIDDEDCLVSTNPLCPTNSVSK